MSASFLPRGSSLLIYFSATGGVQSNKHTGKPARLDWDFFNNMGYSRVHWVPQSELVNDNAALVELIGHEISIIQRERKEYDEAQRI